MGQAQNSTSIGNKRQRYDEQYVRKSLANKKLIYMADYNFRKVRSYANFMQGAQNLLSRTIENFFSAKVRIHFEPFRELVPAYGIDILECRKRYVYILSSDRVLIVPRMSDGNGNTYYLAILIEGKDVGQYKRRSIFNHLASSISTSLRDSYQYRFWDAVKHFDERLIIRSISHYLAKRQFNPYKINTIITKFNALRSTTFEGKYFSTGIIFTATLADYKKDIGCGGRWGVVMGLHNTQHVYDDIDTRFWYLADGINNFYLSDSKESVHYMFVYKNEDNNYLNRMVLTNALKGRDFLLRVFAGRELSVITSQQVEFIYQENTWRYRDYEWLKTRICNAIPLNGKVYNAILYFVLFCSKNDISSILWIPKDLSNIDNFVQVKRSFSNKIINMTDRDNEGLIKRMLSSDGATVVTTNGDVKYYGCIAKLKAQKTKKAKGTGETAAGNLAENGIAFKISQDGVIKVFLKKNSDPIRF